jgi:hypothetical protein
MDVGRRESLGKIGCSFFYLSHHLGGCFDFLTVTLSYVGLQIGLPSSIWIAAWLHPWNKCQIETVKKKNTR